MNGLIVPMNRIIQSPRRPGPIFFGGKGPNLIQTDNAAPDGSIVACSGATKATTPNSNATVLSGTAGSTSHTVTVAASSTQAAVMFESSVGSPGVNSWTSGTWTVPLNITTGNSKMTWTQLWICRLNSSGVVQSTVGSNTTISQAITTPSVYSASITTSSAQITSTTDRIYWVLVFQNSSGVAGSFVYLSNQTMTIPFTPAA